MKHLKKMMVVMALGGWLFSSTVVAGQGVEGDPEPGFSGYIMVGGGFARGKLSLDDASEDEDKSIDSLNRSGQTQSEFFPVIGGGLRYHFATTGTTVEVNMDEGAGVDIRQPAGSLGTVGTGIHFRSEDVWADPYLTGRARSDTDREVAAFYLGWEGIMDSGFSVTYTLEHVDVDKDLAGKQNASLRRDGNIHGVALSYDLAVDPVNFISAGVGCELGDMDGSAQEFKGYELFLSHSHRGDGWDLATSLSWGRTDFDHNHPVFNRTRRDTRYAVETAYTLYTPFGLEDYAITLFAGYEARASNIDFYDRSMFSGGVAVTLEF